jgi:hypothetical protein
VENTYEESLKIPKALEEMILHQMQVRYYATLGSICGMNVNVYEVYYVKPRQTTLNEFMELK